METSCLLGKIKRSLACTLATGKIVHVSATNGKILNKVEEEEHSINCLDFNKDGS